MKSALPKGALVAEAEDVMLDVPGDEILSEVCGGVLPFPERIIAVFCRHIASPVLPLSKRVGRRHWNSASSFHRLISRMFQDTLHI